MSLLPRAHDGTGSGGGVSGPRERLRRGISIFNDGFTRGDEYGRILEEEDDEGVEQVLGKGSPGGGGIYRDMEDMESTDTFLEQGRVEEAGSKYLKATVWLRRKRRLGSPSGMYVASILSFFLFCLEVFVEGLILRKWQTFGLLFSILELVVAVQVVIPAGRSDCGSDDGLVLYPDGALVR